MKETLTARRLVRRSATAIAILAFFSVFSLGGLCFMDMSAASQHDCCKKTGLTAAPPRCCATSQVTVAMVTSKAPRALPGPAVHAPRVSLEPLRVTGPSPVEVPAVPLSRPALLRI